MKKILLTVICAACCMGTLHAQGRHEINAFLGGYKSEFVKVDNENGQYHSMLFDEFNDGIHVGDLYDLYEPHYIIESGPVVTVDYHYVINDWLRVGAQGNFGTIAGKFWYVLGNKPAETFDEIMLSVLPEAKLCLPIWSGFRLYGKVAAGLQVNLGDRLSPSPVGFAWDVAPIGAEWGGKRIYGNAEVCFGSVIRGGRIGIGFRF